MVRKKITTEINKVIAKERLRLMKEEKKRKKELKKPIKVKAILKKSRATLTIPDYKAPSILGDENRFFRGQIKSGGFL